jgi:hypothetical protein
MENWVLTTFLRAGLIGAVLRVFTITACMSAVFYAIRRSDHVPLTLKSAWFLSLLMAAFDLYYISHCMMPVWMVMREISLAFAQDVIIPLVTSSVTCAVVGLHMHDARVRKQYLTIALLTLIGSAVIGIFTQLQVTGLDLLESERQQSHRAYR